MEPIDEGPIKKGWIVLAFAIVFVTLDYFNAEILS